MERVSRDHRMEYLRLRVCVLIVGRMGQLGKIHYINTKAFLEAARHVMIEYGEYTDAEVEVLCRSYSCPLLHCSLFFGNLLDDSLNLWRCSSLPDHARDLNSGANRQHKLIWRK
jgi:hypothetical protein